MAIHFEDIRLHNNAGMRFPMCYTNSKKGLDLDKSVLKTTADIDFVTCKHCIRKHPKRYPWARQRQKGL